MTIRTGQWCLAHLLLLATAADAQRLETPYTAASGVPTPPFGLDQRAGAVTHYVNNTHPEATDTLNAQGTRERPRATIPERLRAGDVVEVRGGPYAVDRVAWTGEGTATKPVFISGFGNPEIRGRDVQLYGQYFIVEGLVFAGVPVKMQPGTHHLVLRHSTVRHWSPSAHSAAIVPMGRDLVIYGNEIHNNGDPEGRAEIDIHGIKSPAGAERVWILSNHIHHNGGDGIQMGNSSSPEPWPRFIYIARNVIHQDRENGIDIKKARDVVISSNIVYGYEARSSSAGEAIVTHDGAELVWILNNGIGNSRIGIVSTGANGYIVMGNIINAINHHPEDRQYNPTNLYRAAAILTYNTRNSAHVNNTIWNSDAGISYAGGTAPTIIMNNLIGAPVQPSHHLAIGNTVARSGSVVRRNLLVGEPRVRLGGQAAGCPDRETCFTADGGMIDPPRNMQLQKSSPAIDAGAESDLFETFRKLYGFSLSNDLYGVPRRQGGRVDIGASEFSVGTPPKPKKPRIVP